MVLPRVMGSALPASLPQGGSSSFWVPGRSGSAARISSLGRVVRYSAARTLFGNPSSAYLATPVRCSAQRIRPTGDQPGLVCRAVLAPLLELDDPPTDGPARIGADGGYRGTSEIIRQAGV